MALLDPFTRRSGVVGSAQVPAHPAGRGSSSTPGRPGRLRRAGDARGAHGYLSKALPADELVAALEKVHLGERLVAVDQLAGRHERRTTIEIGLTPRETDVLALIAAGAPNKEISRRLELSMNTVKSHIRTAYRAMGVTSRTQAVLWAVEHGITAPRLDVSERPPESADPAGVVGQAHRPAGPVEVGQQWQYDAPRRAERLTRLARGERLRQGGEQLRRRRRRLPGSNATPSPTTRSSPARARRARVTRSRPSSASRSAPGAWNGASSRSAAQHVQGLAHRRRQAGCRRRGVRRDVVPDRRRGAPAGRGPGAPARATASAGERPSSDAVTASTSWARQAARLAADTSQSPAANAPSGSGASGTPSRRSRLWRTAPRASSSATRSRPCRPSSSARARAAPRRVSGGGAASSTSAPHRVRLPGSRSTSRSPCRSGNGGSVRRRAWWAPSGRACTDCRALPTCSNGRSGSGPSRSSRTSTSATSSNASGVTSTPPRPSRSGPRPPSCTATRAGPETAVDRLPQALQPAHPHGVPTEHQHVTDAGACPPAACR